MTVKHALFDLGRVVLDWEPRRLYAKLFDDPAELDRFLSEVCTMDWHTKHDAGVSFEDNAATLIAQHPKYENEIRAWGSRWMEMFEGYVEGSQRLVERLSARGASIYALSNMPAETWPLMRKHFPTLARFEHVIVSGEVGMVKPNAEIFHYALTKMGDPPAETVLFIDDSLTNIKTAAAMGFATHLFTNAPALEARLVAERLL